jgi:hypothetical protein
MSEIKKYSFKTLTELENHLEKQGYCSGELANKIHDEIEFPSAKRQLSIEWYPHKYFQKHGGYDGKSTLDTTLCIYDSASDPEIAKEFCMHSIFMTSFRENVIFVFRFLEARKGIIALPAGGIPYYVPTVLQVEIYDTDSSLKSELENWPNCKAILGPEGDVFQMNKQYDTICCMGFSFYLNKKDFVRFLKQFHSCLNTDGILLLNFILATDEQGTCNYGYNYFKTKNFQKAMDWNMEVISALNSQPKFNSYFISRTELSEACQNLFSIEQIHLGTLAVHATAVLKKIE